MRDIISLLLYSQPNLYLKEIREKLGLYQSIPTIWKTLNSMGLTWKALDERASQRSDLIRAKFIERMIGLQKSSKKKKKLKA